MDRETRTIKTPAEEHEVVLKEWLTGREKRKLSKIVQAGMRFSMKGTGKEADAEFESERIAEVLEQAEDETIKEVVVSVDGEEEGVLDKVLDMKSEDYDFVMTEINKVTEGKDFTQTESAR